MALAVSPFLFWVAFENIYDYKLIFSMGFIIFKGLGPLEPFPFVV